MIRRISVLTDNPVQVGTYVGCIFRVTGYDSDCDGSLLARLESVDENGDSTGWDTTHIGLDPSSFVIADDPAELHRLAAAR